jgi:methylthioribose-1-phosphate isomerase
MTDAGGGSADQERGEAAGRERASRRQFFRVFGRQTVSSAGNVLAGVEALRRTSQEALDDLVAGDEQAAARPADLRASPSISAAPVAAHGAAAYRSPYRYTGSGLEILDQSGLPSRAAVIECTAASEVASAIRQGLLSGGPVLGQVAAYTLAMLLARNPGRNGYARQQALAGAADTLRPARPANRALAVALERVLDRATAAGEDDPDSVDAAVLAEADEIAAEAAADHSRLGQLGAEAMREAAEEAAADGRQVSVLMHGDHGPLTGGQIGPGVAVLQALAGSGWPVHAWLTEAAPLYEGRRAAWQLANLDIACTLVPDTALSWLLANRQIDVLMLRAESVAANGDLVAPLGSLVATRLARAAGVPVTACVPLTLVDPGLASAAGVPTDLRLPAPSPGGLARIDPAFDLVPAGLLDALLTDEGALPPPYPAALAEASRQRESRHGGGFALQQETA